MSEVEMSATSASDTDTEVTAEPIIKVSNLTKKFDDLVAVDSASCNVRDGEYFSIIGPSGSGKTTLLRMLAGFEEPTTGTVSIEGKDCTYDKPYHRSTNMIFQDLALFPHLNVRENISYGLIEAGIDKETQKEKVDEALRTVDLEGYQNRNISELSGGEQQRVALARGLVNEPSVLLLDEPLASLDEKLKESMKVELKRIQDRTNTTFIYVTHDQEVAMAMSDRIAIIDDGIIQQVASPQEMYTKPANTFVADFTGAENIYEVSIVQSDGDTGVVRIGDREFQANFAEDVQSKNADDNIRLIIRPETISVSSSDGRVSGIITDLVYKGALVNVIVDIDIGDGQIPMQAEVHSEEIQALSEGDTVYLDWNDQNPLVVGRQ